MLNSTECLVQKLHSYFDTANASNDLLSFLNTGCKDKTYGPLLKELMQTTNFRVTVVEESDVVEICGALKVTFTALSFHSHLRNSHVSARINQKHVAFEWQVEDNVVHVSIQNIHLQMHT